MELNATQKQTQSGTWTTKLAVRNDEYLGKVQSSGENSQVSADRLASTLRVLGVTGTIKVNVKDGDPFEVSI